LHLGEVGLTGKRVVRAHNELLSLHVDDPDIENVVRGPVPDIVLS
jgi:hypothetical protein